MNALIIFTTNNESQTNRVKLIPRNFIKNYPLKEFIKLSESGRYLHLSREYAVSTLTGLEQEIFDEVHHDLYRTLPSLNSSEIDLRDCIVVTRYQITQCWAIFVGTTFRGIECSTSYETETTGCDGAHVNGGINGPNNGPSVITLGGGTGSGNSNGNTSIDRDPCEEDGINCEDSDEDKIDKLNPLLIYLLNGQHGINSVSSNLSPCIHSIVDRFLNDFSQNISDLIQTHIGVPTNYGIEVVSGYLSPETNGQTISGVDPSTGAFMSTITINSNLDNCTQDRILATLYHEMIHAQLSTMWYFANNSLPGSSFDRAAFLDLYPTWLNPSIDPMIQLNQHELMTNQAGLFIHDMIINLRAFNPALSQETARSMVLSGFQGTNYWENVLTQDERDATLTAINASRCINGNQPSSSFNFVMCP